ncbi:aminotransferase class I/II-fold pyridoxal phosphate-dependent enzyme [Echinicola vietnamensis]|uniref:PLP-dependent enzyme, glutamate decarboxylase n=1 Tax=Echinicola vietnamensis (strain DSM 17526 / LMG 23754 / KMM 6221) TaxID=926556 RepID=L0FXN1_ECHVK|nr:aminotransferase class I/II-fold pyridoxal phosphate-dependent enzyme [Echinicola vietnamensis]AGA77415.1 PLP-dependent enzyme, glutamate decarboxylase [Echinicola vietnamensis DSM 17526]
MFWKKLSHEEVKKQIFGALAQNHNYRGEYPALGVPGTYLDTTEFYHDAPFLKDAPFMSVMVQNPNHIGIHTLSEESVLDLFQGTQKIERDLINLVAEEVFAGEQGQQDGYVATGGTEANIQAMWVYRNFFQAEYGAKTEEIAVVYSSDSHYSMPKGANLLNLHNIILEVDEETRQITQASLESKITEAKENGVKYFIVIANLSTTMFGSVDDVDRLGDFFTTANVTFRIHVDAAYGGFIYPFTNEESTYTFQNPYITSFTSDGHKMLQTPYGTGLFLIRKGYIHHVCTEEAQYIPGKDYTLCGSRSGANAVSMWMILKIHGSEGWKYKMASLCDRTERICTRLDRMGVKYFRNPHLNIITIKSEFISPRIAKKYNLVADSYEFKPKWYKIVVMHHVRQGVLDSFLMDLEGELVSKG